MNSPGEYVEFARSLARAAREHILPLYRQSIAIDTKEDSSPVTRADREAETRLREMITSAYPDHGITGEEFGDHAPDAEFRWVLDPIDGTKTFISGVPLFGTLIALCRGGEPILGVIDLPVLDQCLVGTGNWTELNGARVRMREVRTLEEAVLLATDHFHIGRFRRQAPFDALARRVRLYRTWGDCFGYTLLAAGYADIMVDPVMHAWDIMALVPVIRGAGGVISDYEGGNPVGGDAVVAAHPLLHPLVIGLLNGEERI